MYCPYCQTMVAQDTVFCHHCGKQLRTTDIKTVSADAGQQEQPVQTTKQELRNSELSKLKSAIIYFSQKQNVYDHYDLTCSKLNRLARGASNALLIWGGIVIGLFVLCLLAVLSSQDADGGVVACVLFLLFPGIAMIGGGISKKIHHQNMVACYQQQYAELSRELHQHFRNYPNCPIVPECTNPRILVKLQKLLLAGSADTIKEGMNILFASSSYKSIARYQEIMGRNTNDCNWRNELTFIFLPPGYFH